MPDLEESFMSAALSAQPAVNPMGRVMGPSGDLRRTNTSRRCDVTVPKLIAYRMVMRR